MSKPERTEHVVVIEREGQRAAAFFDGNPYDFIRARRLAQESGGMIEIHVTQEQS